MIKIKPDRYLQTIYIDREITNQVKLISQRNGASFNSTIVHLIQLGVLVDKKQEFVLPAIITDVQEGQ